MMGMTRVVLVVVLAIAMSIINGTEAFIGMSWGRQSAQRLLPSQVVDLMLQNGIGNARIYSTQEDILKAFGGSGINLTITIFGTGVPGYPNARAWFQKKGGLIVDAHVRCVIVGGYHVFDLRNPFTPPIEDSMATLLDVQSAFDEAGYGHQIKANFVHNTNILIDNVRRPSDADFRPEIKDKMSEFLHFLQQQNAPFLLDMFPIQDVYSNTYLNPTFGFPDNTSDIVIKDINGAVYTNVFEWQYDCFAWALYKLNASTVKIVVNQVGWPTDGVDGANAANAERFFKHLLPLVAGNKGTPMRPGAPIDIFINSLTDEPKMVDITKPFMRHWGVYRSNGEPKYKIDLSGQGRDIFPTTVRGIMHMPHRWCVFNGNDTDMEKVRNQTELACKQGDCTTLSPLASCSHLSFDKNVSYAFNSFFQTFFQDEAACDFDGLGYVSDDDPSTEGCVFPVEVVRGRQVMESRWAAAQHLTPPPKYSAALFLFMLSIFNLL